MSEKKSIMLFECSKIQPLLSEYIGDALSPDKQFQIKEHLDTCAVCAKIAQDFSATRQMLQILPEQQLSSDFESKLAARLADIALTKPQAVHSISWRERLQQLFFGSRRNSVFAGGLAFAALVPLAIVFAGARGRHNPMPIVASSPSAGDATLAEIFDEHDAHQTAQSLEDSTVALDGTLLSKVN
jgi:anti-sigma factor RsiW